jgi:hypothetical protein
MGLQAFEASAFFKEPFWSRTLFKLGMRGDRAGR